MYLYRYLRGSALRVSVAHNDTDSVKNATEKFKEFMKNSKTSAFKYFFYLVVAQPKLTLYNTQYD